MSPQTGFFTADFDEEVVSVAPDDHVRSQPSESDFLPYFVPLPPTTLHFSPHLKWVSAQVKRNRVDL